MSAGGEPFAPYAFLLALRQKFPQFAQQGQGGAFSQQDAEECWTNLLYALREKVKVRCVCTCMCWRAHPTTWTPCCHSTPRAHTGG